MLLSHKTSIKISLFDAWLHEVPPPSSDPEQVLEELAELEQNNYPKQ